METFQIKYSRQDDDEEIGTTEFMAKDDTEAASIFKSIEPFMMILKIKQE